MTVQKVRKLVEEDKVLFVFNIFGTPINSAVHKHLTEAGAAAVRRDRRIQVGQYQGVPVDHGF